MAGRHRIAPFTLAGLLSRTQFVSVTGCMEWRDGCTGKHHDRPAVWNGTKKEYAARAVWRLSHGRSIPSGLLVCHSCDNPKCLNPKHLWLGTNRDNLHDMSRKGRGRKPNTK